MTSITAIGNINIFLRCKSLAGRSSGEAEFKHVFPERAAAANGKSPGIHFFRLRGVEYAFATPAQRVDPSGGVRYHDGIDHLGNRYFVKKVGTNRDKYGELSKYVCYETDGPHAIASPVAPALEAIYGSQTSGHRALFIPLQVDDIFALCLGEHPIDKRARSAYAAMKYLCGEALKFHTKTHQAHLDIKPHNVFHDGKSLILGDYGCAAHIENDPKQIILRAEAELRTLGFSSPELFPSGTSIRGAPMLKIDSWGIALVCLSIFGFNPFWGRVFRAREYTEATVMLAHLEFEQIRHDRYATHVTLSADVARAIGREVCPRR